MAVETGNTYISKERALQ